MERIPKKINISEYYSDYSTLPIIDVRSPGEFKKGHMPGAKSISLFSDEERAKVGTAYTRQSKEIAMNIGLKFVQPKLQNFIHESRKRAPDGRVIVHCWRGGMRSASFAQHLIDNGFEEVFVLEGGYKAFRTHVIQFFDQSFKLNVIGGYTGSGKTKILEFIKAKSNQVLDLEALAHHRGSAFGGINMGAQPSVEQFEINLFEQFRRLDLTKVIWVEDESHHIGSVFIPIPLFKQMEKSWVYFLNIPIEERAKYLIEEYGSLDKNELANSIERIKKRLGFDKVKSALEYLNRNDFYNVALITLKYYDKYYLRGLSRRDPEKVKELKFETINHEEIANFLLTNINYKYND